MPNVNTLTARSGRRLSGSSSVAAVLGCLALLLGLSPQANAQNTASLSGIVTDATGAVVPGAAVTIAHEETGTATEVSTNEVGAYIAAALDVGSYTVEVSTPGFKSFRQAGVVLNVRDRVRIDVALELGEVTETIEVTETAVQLQTENATVEEVVSGKQVDNIAMNGRNFMQLAALVPGASSTNNFGFNTPTGVGSGGAANISFNGMRRNHNVWRVDGQENYDRGCGGCVEVLPSIDAIQEFKGRDRERRVRCRLRRGRPDQHRRQVRHAGVSRHVLRVRPQRRPRRQQLLREPERSREAEAALQQLRLQHRRPDLVRQLQPRQDQDLLLLEPRVALHPAGHPVQPQRRLAGDARGRLQRRERHHRSRHGRPVPAEPDPRLAPRFQRDPPRRPELRAARAQHGGRHLHGRRRLAARRAPGDPARRSQHQRQEPRLLPLHSGHEQPDLPDDPVVEPELPDHRHAVQQPAEEVPAAVDGDRLPQRGQRDHDRVLAPAARSGPHGELRPAQRPDHPRAVPGQPRQPHPEPALPRRAERQHQHRLLALDQRPEHLAGAQQHALGARQPHHPLRRGVHAVRQEAGSVRADAGPVHLQSQRRRPRVRELHARPRLPLQRARAADLSLLPDAVGRAVAQRRVARHADTDHEPVPALRHAPAFVRGPGPDRRLLPAPVRLRAGADSARQRPDRGRFRQPAQRHRHRGPERHPARADR